MLSIGWLVGAVVVAILLSTWVTFTVTRLDRLHARVDAAQAALDAQLVRRAAALLHVAEAPTQLARSGVPETQRAGYETVARRALEPDPPVDDPAGGRAVVENAVGRAVRELAQLPAPLPAGTDAELREASTRVLVSRRFYNDAVRDTRALRARRMPRLLHLAGHRALPEFFDIDDTLPTAPDPQPEGATLDGGTIPSTDESDLRTDESGNDAPEPQTVPPRQPTEPRPTPEDPTR